MAGKLTLRTANIQAYGQFLSGLPYLRPATAIPKPKVFSVPQQRVVPASQSPDAQYRPVLPSTFYFILTPKLPGMQLQTKQRLQG
jgi:hypothetical protein